MPDRSIRNVPVSSRRNSGRGELGPRPQHGGYRVAPPPRPHRSRFWLWVVLAIIVCAAVGAALPLLLTGATVTIVPRTANVTLSAPLTVTLQTADASGGPELGFQILEVTASTTRSVAASGTENQTSAAQGTATIFNKYSTSPQTLVANTRFQTADGRIYRIHQTAVVPGDKKNADGSIAPGSVSVTLYADQPGPSYNTGAVQFSIPGFKGTPQYNGFYASTQGITGGASGAQPTVLPADASKATSDMQTELKTTLATELASHVPQGYILVPSAMAISYSDLPTGGTGGTAVLSEAGSASAAIVKTSDLAAAAAVAGIEGYTPGEPVDFVDPTNIPVALASDSSFSADATSLDLSFTAPASLVWTIDTNAVATALAGKAKGDFQTVMNTFKPAVASASASFRPFWLSAFPTDPKKIKVVIESGS